MLRLLGGRDREGGASPGVRVLALLVVVGLVGASAPLVLFAIAWVVEQL